MPKEIAYDLYGGTYVEGRWSDEEREARKAKEQARRFAEMYPGIGETYAKAIADMATFGTGVMFFDEASVLSDDTWKEFWSSRPLPPCEYKWSVPPDMSWLRRSYHEVPQTLRERERAHWVALNGGDKPWKVKRR